MRRVPLGVLYVGTVPAWLYLVRMRQKGVLPQKVLFVRFANYEAYMARQPKLDEGLAQKLLAPFGLSAEEARPFCDAYPVAMREVAVDSLKDPRLARAMEEEAEMPWLYTGGGIVPPRLLNDPKRPLVHIHPGWLPDVRGADGLFWSLLLRKRAGYTLFKMAEGIDTGPILYRRETAVCRFEGLRADEATALALLRWYDPILRIDTLLAWLRERVAWLRLPYDTGAMEQSCAQGRHYHFMHPLLKEAVVSRWFGGADHG